MSDKDFFWNLFLSTGRIEAYLLMKQENSSQTKAEIEEQYRQNSGKEVNREDSASSSVPQTPEKSRTQLLLEKMLDENY